MKKTLITAILAALMLAAAVSADDIAAPETASAPEILTAVDVSKEVPAVATVKGKYPSRVTTAVVDGVDSAAGIFDKKAETWLEVTFPEKTEESAKTVTVSTALQSPAVIDHVAVMLSLPEGAEIEIKVSATNDTTKDEWKQIKVTSTEEKDGFTVCKLEKFARKYSFYRFELTLKNGNSFSLIELQPFGDKTPNLRYDIKDGEVLPGTMPELVPTDPTPEVKNNIPSFPIFNGKLTRM